jgi:hypothetical protein
MHGIADIVFPRGIPEHHFFYSCYPSLLFLKVTGTFIYSLHSINYLCTHLFVIHSGKESPLPNDVQYVDAQPFHMKDFVEFCKTLDKLKADGTVHKTFKEVINDFYHSTLLGDIFKELWMVTFHNDSVLKAREEVKEREAEERATAANEDVLQALQHYKFLKKYMKARKKYQEMIQKAKDLDLLPELTFSRVQELLDIANEIHKA